MQADKLKGDFFLSKYKLVLLDYLHIFLISFFRFERNFNYDCGVQL